MSKLSRIVALAGTALASTVLLIGPASPASAVSASSLTPPIQQVTIEVFFYLTDDDVSQNYGDASSDKETVLVSAAAPTAQVTFRSTACAGDEVRGELALEVVRNSDGSVLVRDQFIGNVAAGLRLYEGQEGTGCPFADLDGKVNVKNITVAPFTLKVHGTAEVGNQDEGGEDHVLVDYYVSNSTP